MRLAATELGSTALEGEKDHRRGILGEDVNLGQIEFEVQRDVGGRQFQEITGCLGLEQEAGKGGVNKPAEEGCSMSPREKRDGNLQEEHSSQAREVTVRGT